MHVTPLSLSLSLSPLFPKVFGASFVLVRAEPNMLA